MLRLMLATPPVLVAKDITLAFHVPDGQKILVLDSISLQVSAGEIVVIIGPSGCGKSSLLRILAGSLAADSGDVSYWDKSNSHLPPVPMVEQTAALLPWRTVRENIRLFSELRRARSLNLDIDKLITKVGLDGFDSYLPASLSGGMNTRVAIARALSVAEHIILLDEAFSDLDEITRFRLLADFCEQVHDQQLAAVVVNHNIEEAVLAADRVIVLSQRPTKIAFEVDVNIMRPRPIGSASFREVQALGALIREKISTIWGHSDTV